MSQPVLQLADSGAPLQTGSKNASRLCLWDVPAYENVGFLPIERPIKMSPQSPSDTTVHVGVREREGSKGEYRQTTLRVIVINTNKWTQTRGIWNR